MQVEEIIDIHRILQLPRRRRIPYRGASFPIVDVDTNTRQYRRVAVGNYVFQTQNMRKGSRNTLWIRQHDQGQITWIFRRRGGYAGVIKSWIEDGEEHMIVQKFGTSSGTVTLYQEPQAS